METPSTGQKGSRRLHLLRCRRPLLLKSSNEIHTLSLCESMSQRSAPPFIPSQASHSISFDQGSLVLKPTTKVHQDPCVNVLKLNAVCMQGILVAGALVIQHAAEEERPTSSHLASVAMTADPLSLAPLASMAATLSMTSAATTLLAPSASVSNQLRALKWQGNGPWQLSWYMCCGKR